MFRRYVISIELADAAVGDLNGLQTELGCSITEPSNWVVYGSTTERGLTFLDSDGKELVSTIFAHQPIFKALDRKAGDEVAEIRSLLYRLIASHYPVTASDLRIKVTEYNRV